MIIELHMLQNFPPSCLNRDDTNSPKECEFGGYRRARISSQCLKRAIRQYFKEKSLLSSDNLAKRTMFLTSDLTERLVKKGKDKEKSIAVISRAISSMGLALKNNQTQYLFFLGEREIVNLADMILEHWSELESVKDEKEKKAKETSGLGKEFLKVFDGGRAADLALFGRMLADLPDKNRDAACQVAHAISTNRVNTEFDFYTAVDDLQPQEITGASMMGTIEYNSACYYRYSNIDLEQLKKNLGGDKESAELAIKTLEAFLRASVAAIPTGKQTSMAAQNPPSFVYGVVRDSGMWNLANAFARPVYSNSGDLILNSEKSLINYWNKLANVYGNAGIKALPVLTLDEGLDLEALEPVNNLEEFIQAMKDKLSFAA